MSNFRNVSTSEPCPICGKPDWCSIQYVEGGEKLHYCRHILCGDNVISPISGQIFVFIKQAKDGSSLYIEEQVYLVSMEEWIKKTAFPWNSSPKRNQLSLPKSALKKLTKKSFPWEMSSLIRFTGASSKIFTFAVNTSVTFCAKVGAMS